MISAIPCDPTLVERLPEVSISDGEDWWMISTVEVLETESITAGSWGRSSINTSDNGCAEHDVWSISVIESSSETCGIGDNTATHDEDWLVSSNSVVLEINEDLLYGSNILIDFVTTVNKLDKLDVVGIEVLLKSGSIDLFDFVVDDGNTSSEWSVIVSEELVGWVQNTSGDFDGSSNGGAHDSLDGLGVSGSKGLTVTVSVDTGWVNGMWVNVLKLLVVLEIVLSLGDVILISLHVILQSNVGKSWLSAQFLDAFIEVSEWLVEVLGSLFDQDGVLSEWQVGEVLELLGDGQKIKVGAQSLGELFGENWESRKIYEAIFDVSLIENLLDEICRVIGFSPLLLVENSKGLFEMGVKVFLVDFIEAIVVKFLDFLLGGSELGFKSSHF